MWFSPCQHETAYSRLFFWYLYDILGYYCSCSLRSKTFIEILMQPPHPQCLAMFLQTWTGACCYPLLFLNIILYTNYNSLCTTKATFEIPELFLYIYKNEPDESILFPSSSCKFSSTFEDRPSIFTARWRQNVHTSYYGVTPAFASENFI